MANEAHAGDHKKPQFKSFANKSPMMITSALKGTAFPATLSQLQDQAKRNGASQEVQDRIARLPEGNYQQMIDVTGNLGQLST